MRMLIHPFVPSARAMSPCDPVKSAQTVPLPNGSKTADRMYQFLVLTKTLKLSNDFVRTPNFYIEQLILFLAYKKFKFKFKFDCRFSCKFKFQSEKNLF
jgi:hypothetical protein